MGTDDGMTPRAWAGLTLVALVLLLVAATALLVPWHRPPAPRADQLAALDELDPAEVARGGPSPPRCAPVATPRWPSGW
ncbi:hypothetical protein GCM10027615_73980 [Plantactinospora veratri]